MNNKEGLELFHYCLFESTHCNQGLYEKVCMCTCQIWVFGLWKFFGLTEVSFWSPIGSLSSQIWLFKTSYTWIFMVFPHFIEPIHKYSDLERTFWATFYIFGPYHSSTDWKMTIVHEIMPICLVRANSEPENALKIGPFVSIKGLFRWVEVRNTTW